MAKGNAQTKTPRVMTEKKLQKSFEQSKKKAKKILNDKDKMDLFLERLEKKLALIPIAGGMLAEIPVLISLVKAYLEKRYSKVPIGTVIAIVGALIYFLSPIDLVPDLLPAIGLVDDAAVIALALKLVHDDVKEYKSWKEENNVNIP